MRQRGQHHEDVHRRKQLNVIPGAAVAGNKLKRPSLIDGDFAEEVHHHQQVFQAEIPFAHLNQQVIDAVAVEAVAQLLVASCAIFSASLRR
jgi:hypothetical protein